MPIFLYKASEWRLVKAYRPHDPDDFGGIMWPGNNPNVPLSHPVCGWENEFCQDENKNPTIMATAAVVGIMFIIIVASAIWLKKYRYSLMVFA